MLMSSGQWDLNALEALEREALEVFDVVEVPDHVRCPQPLSQVQPQPQSQPQPPPPLTNLPPGHTTFHPHRHTHAIVSTADIMDIELEDHIKHCSCTCNHMGYGNFMDYQVHYLTAPPDDNQTCSVPFHDAASYVLTPNTQTSCFGGLPDVTEHSNCHQITRREPSLNSENLDTSSHQKAPLPSRDTTPTPTSASSSKEPKRKLNKKCCVCACLTILILTSCALIGVLVIHLIFGDSSGDRESHEQRMKIVRRLLKETPLIDGHNDLPWNIRRFAHSRLEYLNFSTGLDNTEPWNKSPWSQTDLVRLSKGLVGGQFWSAYVPCEAQSLDAVQLALEQIDLIQRFTNSYRKHMVFVKSSQDIIATHRNGLIASLIGVEGGHALGASLGVLRTLYHLGARYLTLTHTCDNRWAGSAKSGDVGLSPFGRAIIKEMNRLGMMIDLSYSSDATARDVLRETRAPIMFSHSAARSLCNSSRNIGDDMLREVAENGGIVMVSFYSLYLTCSRSSTIQDVITHINYIRAIAGVQHIGIGAGYDGIDSPPLGLENVAKYPYLFTELLKDPNWTEEDLQLLAGGNLLRVFRSVENVRDYWKRAAILPVETLAPPNYSPCTYMPS